MIQSMMFDLFRVTLLLCIMLYLLRKGLGIGYVMVIASSTLIIFYGMHASGVLLALKRAATSHIAIALLVSLSLIRILELVLREQNVLSAMMHKIKGSTKSRKMVIVSMPLLIGMLPSLGGAYFSAPMVQEATEHMSMSNEERAFINYWFRHPWEYVLPLYPGIVFASAVSGVPLNRMIIANVTCAVMTVISGLAFSMRDVGRPSGDSRCNDEAFRDLRGSSRAWLNFLPIGAVLFLVIFLHMELHYALLVVIIPLVTYYRYGPKRILGALRYGFSREVIVLIAGIMLFKEMLESSGAIKNLSDFFIAHEVPVLPLFCLLPFIAGMLTGHTVGFVGSTFALLVSVAGAASQPLVSLAFASGFAGVLLSPLHLCLILSKEYFRAELSGIYRMTIPAGLLILAAAFMQYLVAR